MRTEVELGSPPRRRNGQWQPQAGHWPRRSKWHDPLYMGIQQQKKKIRTTIDSVTVSDNDRVFVHQKAAAGNEATPEPTNEVRVGRSAKDRQMAREAKTASFRHNIRPSACVGSGTRRRPCRRCESRHSATHTRGIAIVRATPGSAAPARCDSGRARPSDRNRHRTRSRRKTLAETDRERCLLR